MVTPAAKKIPCMLLFSIVQLSSTTPRGREELPKAGKKNSTPRPALPEMVTLWKSTPVMGACGPLGSKSTPVEAKRDFFFQV